jgi:hypothetical protein
MEILVPDAPPVGPLEPWEWLGSQALLSFC